MIPVEARDTVADFAIAECLGDNDDDQASTIEARGQRKLSEFLVIERQKQIQDTPKVEPYLD
jgi:hypothetical protein